MSTIWENSDGNVDKYRSATTIYLLLILEQSYNIIIYHGVQAPLHGREVVDGLNATGEKFSFNVNENCDAACDSQMELITQLRT